MQLELAFLQNWDDLRFFLAIARHGSLAGAARELQVNHSTVFRRLNALENAYGVRLFERLPTGYVLTEGGEDLLERAARVGELMDDLNRRLVGRDYRLSGTIRLTTTDTLAESFLHLHLKRFHDLHPDIVLEVVTDNLFFDLSRREADVALRPADNPPEHLLGRELATVAWGVYGSIDYLAERRAPRRKQDLAQHAIISGDDSLAGVPAIRWLKSQVPESAVIYRSSSFGVQFAAAKAGCGLAVLPCILADPSPELTRVLGPIRDLASGLWLLTHTDLRDTVRIRAFMEFMTEAIRGDRARLAGS
ncbi:MAG: LysR family transcriptional regulator [Gammaproteobacteria bacterium]|nr:LysR family transcriptional regulator [Gammaproteobacteria bacterium]